MSTRTPTSSPPAKKARATSPKATVRSNYFVPSDLVWVRPPKHPYWPAEIIEVVEAQPKKKLKNTTTASAPTTTAATSSSLVKDDDDEDAVVQNDAAPTAATAATSSSSALPDAADFYRPCPSLLSSGVAPAKFKCRLFFPPMESLATVDAPGGSLYFFDKVPAENIPTVIEDRLQRKSHDVSKYEAQFYRAVNEANRLARIVLDPNTVVAPSTSAVLPCAPIGIVYSLMRTPTAAPRQPHVPGVSPQTAVIRLPRGMENCVRHLKGFERMWVVFHFNHATTLLTEEEEKAEKEKAEAEKSAVAAAVAAAPPAANDNAASAVAATSAAASAAKTTGKPNSTFSAVPTPGGGAGWKALVVPPRDTIAHGVFATRSPHRPNAIGLSCVKIVDVRGLEVHITDHDLLHGTPVLDLKPYLPFCDAHPNARAGWVDTLNASGRSRGDHKMSTNLPIPVHRAFDDPRQAVAAAAVGGLVGAVPNATEFPEAAAAATAAASKTE